MMAKLIRLQAPAYRAALKRRGARVPTLNQAYEQLAMAHKELCYGRSDGHIFRTTDVLNIQLTAQRVASEVADWTVRQGQVKERLNLTSQDIACALRDAMAANNAITIDVALSHLCGQAQQAIRTVCNRQGVSRVEVLLRDMPEPTLEVWNDGNREREQVQMAPESVLTAMRGYVEAFQDVDDGLTPIGILGTTASVAIEQGGHQVRVVLLLTTPLDLNVQQYVHKSWNTMLVIHPHAGLQKRMTFLRVLVNELAQHERVLVTGMVRWYGGSPQGAQSVNPGVTIHEFEDFNPTVDDFAAVLNRYRPRTVVFVAADAEGNQTSLAEYAEAEGVRFVMDVHEWRENTQERWVPEIHVVLP